MKKLYIIVVLMIIASCLCGQFVDINASLTGVLNSSVAWGDYDNDGDLDILLTGGTNPGNISKVYRNNGNNTFTDINAGLTNVYESSATWGDFDNDGDLDILLTGCVTTGTDISKVYRNNGNNTFTDINAGLIGVRHSSVAWGDYNNDGDLDILLTGFGVAGEISKVYRNNGNNTFSDINAGLSGQGQGSASWGDYDNDGDLDVMITGWSIGGYIAKVYCNNGNDTFTDVNAGLTGVFDSSSAWGDYDNDGDLDIILSGWSDGYIHTCKIYRNDGNNLFTDINANLPGVETGSVAWGDYDNDGNIDILMTGHDGLTRFTRIYHNNCNGTFTDINAGLTGVTGANGSTAWGDYDNDGDLDILITGINGFGEVLATTITKIYRNDFDNANTQPLAPSNLRSCIYGDYVSFQWDSAIDAQTPSLGLNYIMRIGTISGGNDVMSSMASSVGYRRIPYSGYANGNCTWYINKHIFQPGIQYYWSVQAIDGALAGSAFAVEQVYLVQPEITLLSQQTLQYENLPINDFSEWYEVRVQNAYASLTINNLHFLETDSPFQYSYANLGNTIPPGETDTILVRFAPTIVGVVNDTLYIESNAVNMPVLKIRLSGTGISVPPSPPQNISVAMQGWHSSDAVIAWEAVTTDIHGFALSPDCYIVLCNENPYADVLDYAYIGYTEQLSYVHLGVGRFRPQMYYRVIAYKDYGRGGLERLMGLDGVNSRIRYMDLGLE